MSVGKYRVSVFVPSESNGERIPQGKRNLALHDVCVKLSDLYGGATSYECFGYWVSPERGLVLEPTTCVFSFADEQESAEYEGARIAEDLKSTLNQESVLYTVEYVSTVAFI